MTPEQRIVGGMEPEELLHFSLWVERQGGRVIRRLPLIRGLAYCLPAGRMMTRALRSGTWDEPDARVYALTHAGQEIVSPELPWNLVAVQAPLVLDKARGSGIKIAIVDSGIDLHHPGLPHTAEGYNALDPETSPEDDNGHGTHVAGIAAGNWQDGSGVAPEATIVPVKVLDSSGSGNLSDVVDGLNWCLSRNIPIVNMSLGSPRDTQTMRAAVAALWEAGLLAVAAAGNEGPRLGTVSFPARWPEVLAVAASTQDGRIAEFSSRGPQVDLAAPGQSILSTWPGGGTRTLSGTSMAAPHVSGGAALLMELSQKSGYPAVRPGEVIRLLLDGCSKLAGYGSSAQGRGLLQLAASVSLLQP